VIATVMRWEEWVFFSYLPPIRS